MRKVVVVLAIVCAVSCGKKSDKAAAPKDPVTTTDKAVSLVNNAIASAAKVGALSLSADNAAVQSGVVKKTYLTTKVSDVCHETTPVNTADTKFGVGGGIAGEVNERAPYYAAAVWYCMLMNDDASESIPGQFDMISGMTCALGKLKFDGTENNIDATININTDCFSQGFVDTAKTEDGQKITSFKVKVTATALTTGKFDKKVTMVLPKGTMGLSKDSSFNFMYKITDTSIALSTWSQMEDNQEANAASMDIATGMVRYESIQNTWDAAALTENARRIHSRVLIKGTSDATGTFSKVTNMQGAVSRVYYHPAAGQVNYNNYSTNLITMYGEPTTGVKTHDYNSSAAIGTLFTIDQLENLDTEEWPDGVQGSPKVVAERNACFGDTGVTCAGNTGIKPTAAADIAFYLLPKETFPTSPGDAKFDTWANSDAAFLTFDSVQLTAP